MPQKRNERSLLIAKGESPLSYVNNGLDLENSGHEKNVISDVISDTSKTDDPDKPDEKTKDFPPQQESDDVDALSLRSLPRRSFYTLLLIGLGNFILGIVFYFISPFYPIAATAKGMSETVLGVFFGTVHLTIFIFCPLYGNFLCKLGAKFTYVSGIFSGGIVTILFGLLDRCGPGAPFIALSFICRIIVGLGVAAFVTASFAILTNEFPRHVSRAFGLAEIANGIGFMIGPALGGALYQLGGFGLPCYITGLLVLINSALLLVCLPPPKGKIAPRRGSILVLGRSPLVLVSLLNVFSASLGTCFLETSLAIHLSQFQLPTGIVGLLFIIMPLFYGSTSPLAGYISDTRNVHHIQFCAGTTSMFIGYLFIGPSPLFVGMPAKLWMVAICLMLVGFGFGSTVIPSIKCMLIGAIEIGFADNLETYGIVSGSYFSIMCLGGFIGNAVGGVLVDKYGYPTTATVIAFFNLFVTAISLTFFTIRRRRIKREELTQSTTKEPDNDEKSLPETNNSHKLA